MSDDRFRTFPGHTTVECDVDGCIEPATLVDPDARWDETPADYGTYQCPKQHRFQVTPSEALERASAELAVIETEATGTAMVPTGKVDAVAVRARMADARTAMAKQAAHLEALGEAVREEIDRKMSAMRSEMRAKLARLEPLKAEMERLEEGIGAVNLYLGRDEEIVCLRSGDPAPVDTPVTVRQGVLAMDEESAINAANDGVDIRDMEKFCDWLLAAPENLDRMLPEPKGIVAFVPRFTELDYGDPWTSAQLNEANRQTHFLVRNGEQLYVTTVVDYRAGKRLVPLSDEFTAYFTAKQKDPATGHMVTVPLQPGSEAWLLAEKSASARQRHYMKTALILQGLIDRTGVLQPLPAANVSLLEAESYDQGWVQIITDAEKALGTGRPRFSEWLADVNSNFRVGVRIIGAFYGSVWKDYDDTYRHEGASYAQKHRAHSRISPANADGPESGAIYVVESKAKGGDHKIHYSRGSRWDYDDWGRYREIEYKQRASCVVRGDDPFILCLDEASIDDMRYYLNNRVDRHEYRSMFPVLTAAIAAREAEAEAEAPFRQLLAGQVANRNGVDIEEAVEAVDELVAWWKFANRHHRHLVDDPKSEAAAIEAIVVEHAARLKQRKVSPAALTKVLDAADDIMFVARKRDGKIVALSPSDDRDVYVTERIFGARGDLKETREWRTTGRRITSLSPAHTTDRWDGWDTSASTADHLTGPECTEFVDKLIAQVLTDVASYDKRNDRKPTVLHVETFDANKGNRGNELRRHGVWVIERTGTFDADRPLTGVHVKTEVARHTRHWERTADGGFRIVADSDSYHDERSGYADSVQPWNRKDGPDGEQTYMGRCETVRAYPEAVAAYHRHLAALDEAAKGCDRLEALVDQWLEGLEKTWDDIREAKAHARFVEDFGADADMWGAAREEAIRKFDPMPHRYNRSGSHHLVWLARRLVEQGLHLGTLTPREARLLFERKVSTGPDDLPHRTSYFGKRDGTEDIDLEDSILDIVPQPEPLDDEPRRPKRRRPRASKR